MVSHATLRVAIMSAANALNCWLYSNSVEKFFWVTLKSTKKKYHIFMSDRDKNSHFYFIIISIIGRFAHPVSSAKINLIKKKLKSKNTIIALNGENLLDTKAYLKGVSGSLNK